MTIVVLVMLFLVGAAWAFYLYRPHRPVEFVPTPVTPGPKLRIRGYCGGAKPTSGDNRKWKLPWNSFAPRRDRAKHDTGRRQRR